jgi:hypothetical protein
MSEPIDDDFDYFYNDEGFGPAVHTQPASSEKIAKYKGKLPDQLLKYWELYGFSGYGKGLFWLVDPDEYEPALEAWIGDTDFMETDEHYVIARNAFGKLFLWGKKTGQNLTINSPWAMIFPRDNSEILNRRGADFLVQSFISARQKSRLDFEDHLEKPLFERALKALGPLAPDEMYGFVPALALGGKADLKFLQKVKAVEHLVVLAQLGEKRIMRDIVQDVAEAKAKGQM